MRKTMTAAIALLMAGHAWAQEHDEAAREALAAAGMPGAHWDEAVPGPDGDVTVTGLSWGGDGSYFRAGSMTVSAGGARSELEAEDVTLRVGSFTMSADRLSGTGVAASRSGGSPTFRSVSAGGAVLAWAGTAILLDGDVELAVDEWDRQGLPGVARASAAGEGGDGQALSLAAGLVTSPRTGTAVVDGSLSAGGGSALARVSLAGIDASWKAGAASWLADPEPSGGDRGDRLMSQVAVSHAAFAFRGFAGAQEAAAGMSWGSRALRWVVNGVAERLADGGGDVGITVEPARPLTLWSVFSPESHIAPHAFGPAFDER